MNIYDAIMKAADQIERAPQSFSYWSVVTPSNECGTRGCALGWIGFYAGMLGESVGKVEEALGTTEFYSVMRTLECRVSMDEPYEIAAGLRRFAETYHAPKPHFTGLPDIVRDIFTKRPVNLIQAADSDNGIDHPLAQPR